MTSFDFDTAQARLDLVEYADHDDVVAIECDVLKGFRGHGQDYEEDWATVTRKFYNVPVRYHADVYLDGHRVLAYTMEADDYIEDVVEFHCDDLDDVTCDDQDFFEWVWDRANEETTWFGDYVLNGEDTDYFGPGKPCTVEDVARMDGRWFDKVEVVRQ